MRAPVCFGTQLPRSLDIRVQAHESERTLSLIRVRVATNANLSNKGVQFAVSCDLHIITLPRTEEVRLTLVTATRLHQCLPN